MKKQILILVLALPLLWGCVLGCEVEKKIASGLADKIVSVASCKDKAAVQADVLSALDVVKFCALDEKCKARMLKDGPKEGPIANIVCPLAAKTLVSVVGKVLPAKWQCDPSANPATVTVVTLACEQLPL